MSPLAIVVCVFAVLGALSTLATVLGATLPATSSVGAWFRMVGVDLKALLGLEPTVKTVVSTVVVKKA